MEIGGLCRIETEDDSSHSGANAVHVSGDNSLDLGDCYPGLLKVVKFKLTNLTDDDLEIHVQEQSWLQGGRTKEVLFVGKGKLLDETRLAVSLADRSVSKRLGQLYDNNQVLSSDFSYATFQRPFIDLLSTKLVSGSGSVSASTGAGTGAERDRGAAAGKQQQGGRPRSASGTSGDGTVGGEDMHSQSLCGGEGEGGASTEDCDGQVRYLFHDNKRLSLVRPAVVSKVRKLQHKMRTDTTESRVGEWRVQVAANSSGHVYFVVCPHAPSEDSTRPDGFETVLTWKLQCPSANMYAFRRANWDLRMRVSGSAGGEEGGRDPAPLSVSRNLAVPFSQVVGTVVGGGNTGASEVAVMKCRGRLLVSSVAISPTSINFGECNVGEFKSESITLVNTSDVSALVIPYFESNTITLSIRHVLLKPGQSCRVSIDYVVRVVEPAYSKTITFVNLLNPNAAVKLEIRAKNVDTYQMLLHDIFYKLYTYSNSKQIILYSKQCSFCRPNVRVFSVRNVYSAALQMKLKSDNSREVSIYCLDDVALESDGEVLNALRMQKYAGEAHRDARGGHGHGGKHARLDSREADVEKSVHSLFPRDDTAAIGDSAVAPVDVMSCLTALYRCSSDVSKAINKTLATETSSSGNGSGNSQHVTNTREKAAHRSTSSHSYSAGASTEVDIDAEERVVRQYENYFNIFQKITSTSEVSDSGKAAALRPAFVDDVATPVTIPVGATQHFAVVMTPACYDSSEELEAVEFFNSIHLELLSVNKQHVSEHLMKGDSTPPADSGSSLDPPSDLASFVASPAAVLKSRTIPIHAFVTRSECVVMQKNINFGKTTIGDPPARKSVVLVNRSAVPLLFIVSKSRSIASEYMKLSPGGHRGVIPPKSSHTVHISFKPTLAGNFEETLTVRNVFNPENIQSIVVKSVVLKPEKFVILPASSAAAGGESPVDASAAPAPVAASPTPADDSDAAAVEDELSVPMPEAIQSAAVDQTYQISVDAINTWISNDAASSSPDSIAPIFLGEVFVGEQAAEILSFKVRNVTHKRRDFIIDTGHSKAVSVLRTDHCPFEPVADTLNSVCAMICSFKELIDNTVVHSMDVQIEYRDKLEKYKQDLKKAQRKNKVEKIAKIEQIILKIEGILSGKKITALDENDGDAAAAEAAAEPSADASLEAGVSPSTSENAPSAVVRDANVFHFQLEPEREILLAITVRLIPGRSYVPWKGYVLPFLGHLRIFENKNEDLIKFVSFGALVHSQRPETAESQASPGESSSAMSANSSGFLGMSEVLSQAPFIGSDGSVDASELGRYDYTSASTFSDMLSAPQGRTSGKLNDENRNKKRVIAFVARWSSCQTKHIFPGYRTFRNKMLPVSCKLVHISTSSRNAVSKMHGLISVTSMTPGNAKLTIWFENNFPDSPDPEYCYLSPDANGPIMVSVLSARGDSGHLLKSGGDAAPSADLFIKEGETINFLIQWIPSTRDLIGMRFAYVLGINIERDDDHLSLLDTSATQNESQRENPKNALNHDFSLRVPIVCFMEHTTSMKVEKYINLGDVPLGSSVTAESIIQNVSEEEALHYVTSLVDLTNISADCGRIELGRGSTGVIGPGASKNIEISFAAVAIGKFDQEMLITNMNEIFDQKRILVTASITMPQSRFVSFPDVTNSGEGSTAGMLFDLGLIQVAAPTADTDHSYFGEENSRPFRIANISEKILYVSAHSNLKKQCFIYGDKMGMDHVVSMPLEPGVTTTVYIAIRRRADAALSGSGRVAKAAAVASTPDGSNGAAGAGLAEHRAEHPRDLVGGIRFTFYESDEAATQDAKDAGSLVDELAYQPTLTKLFETRPIEIRARLGCSSMRLSVSSSRYRCVPTHCRGGNRLFRGSFKVENPSPYFRLRYKYSGAYKFCYDKAVPLAQRSVEKIKKSGLFDIVVPAGEIQFMILDSVENTLEPGCSECVDYVILFTEIKGLYTRNISLVNTVTGDRQSLELNFFFDPQKLISSIPNSLLRECNNVMKGRPATPEGRHHTDSPTSLAAGSASDKTDIKYAEGVYITAVDAVSCKHPIWVDKTADLTMYSKARDDSKAEEARKLLSGIFEPNSGLDDVSREADKSTACIPASFTVVGCSDPSGYMCQWDVYNALSKPVRIVPVSNLPVHVTSKLVLKSDLSTATDLAEFATQRKNSSGTVKKYQSPASVEAFSKFSFNQTKPKSSSEAFNSDAAPDRDRDRYADSSRSIMELPSELWRKDLRRCGDSLTLNPGESAVIRVNCEVGGVLPKTIASALRKKTDVGSLLEGDGIVAFLSAQRTLGSFFQDPVDETGSSDTKNDADTEPGDSEMLNMLPAIGYARIMCKYVSPRIQIANTTISIRNVRSGQMLNLELEVLNVSDVDVPVALKNLPEWIKLDRIHSTRYLGSDFHVPARSSFKFILSISKVPESREQICESVLRHEIYVCNMCRAFSDYNYERIPVQIELHVNPAVALLLSSESGSVHDIKDEVAHSCLKLGVLDLPYTADICDAQYIGQEDIEFCDEKLFSACAPYISSDNTFKLQLTEESSRGTISSAPLSTVLHVRNALSNCVSVVAELEVETELQDVVELKLFHHGGLVPVQCFDMLPGESAEFTVVTTFINSDPMSTVGLPLYTKKFIKQRSGSRHLNPGENLEEDELRKNNSSDSDSSSTSDSDAEVSDEESEDESVSAASSEEQRSLVLLPPGRLLSVAGSSDTAQMSIDVPCSGSSGGALRVRSVHIGRLKLKPKGSETDYDDVDDMKTAEKHEDTTLDTIYVDLVCTIAVDASSAEKDCI
jgi:hypothetical protein